MPTAYRAYEKRAMPFINKINAKKSTKPEKTQASEQVGTLAAIAYNARRLGITFNQSEARHVEFTAAGVFDLIMPVAKGGVEVKEAKGGKSNCGTCTDSSGKPVKQCTQAYNRVVAAKMRNSNYKGKHPLVGCSAHTAAPSGACKACVGKERARRRKWGLSVESAMSKGVMKKIAVRGNYKKTCPLNPTVIKAYLVSKTGKEVPLATPVY